MKRVGGGNGKKQQPGGSVVICSVRSTQTKPPCFNVTSSSLTLTAQHVHLAYQPVQVVLATVNTVSSSDTGIHPSGLMVLLHT